ncbi:MAG: histidinol dehydrogenase, partial [Candidatus Microthrix parvicella]
MLSILDRRNTADPAGDLPRPVLDGDEPTEVVRGIIESVRADGDAALIELTTRFDGAHLDDVRVPTDDLDR